MKYIQDLVKTLQGGTNTTGVFLGLLTLVTVIAAVAHLIFIFLFDSAGVAWMARANVASVLVYALSALLLQNGRHMLAMVLIVGEILIHGILAVVVIGWESGFHYYIILIIPVAILSNFHNNWFKAVLATAVGALYMVLDFIFRHAAPLDTVPVTMLQGLHYFNQASTLCILAMLATAYYRLVANAEACLRHQACTDPLTQLQNRRFAMEVAQHEAAVFERGGRPLALVLGDVDHFKRINDVHGHETGDTALKAVAQALRAGVREIDHVARWGGEEFLMLLPSTDEAEAMRVSERLRQAIARIDLVHQHQRVPISITLGVSLLAKGETIEQALARADQALYKGKTAGRNCVILAGHEA